MKHWHPNIHLCQSRRDTLWPASEAQAGHVHRPRPGLASRLPAERPGLLVVERLVAEVVRLGFEGVLPGHPLVAPDEKGRCPCHHGKDGHHDEDNVAGGQAWLRTWRLTCRGGDRHKVRGLPKPGGRRLRGLLPPVVPALRRCGLTVAWRAQDRAWEQ